MPLLEEEIYSIQRQEKEVQSRWLLLDMTTGFSSHLSFSLERGQIYLRSHMEEHLKLLQHDSFNDYLNSVKSY